MFDLTSESLLTLPEAAKRLPRGRRGRPMHMSAVLRWVLTGVPAPDGQRVRLEAARVGGRWLTSAEALQRFAERLTPSFDGVAAPTSRTMSQREKANARALKELEREGI